MTKLLNLEDFEYELWRMLHTQPISTTLQQQIGMRTLDLARSRITLASAEKRGGPIHYFAEKPPLLSACGRAYARSLPLERITHDSSQTTCKNCLRGISE